MNPKITAAVLGILILLIAGVAYLYSTRYRNVIAVNTPSQTVSNIDDQTIRALITAFGGQLKTVSLLNPTAASQIAGQYAPFATPELLAKWEQNPGDALGRQTSSPWPDRIDIVNVRITGNRATALGNVIEVTSADASNTPAAVYPVTFDLTKHNGQWLISAIDKGAYSELPKQVTVSGVWECLPHTDTSGPQTTECAFGIEADDGSHYAIDTHLSQYPVDFATGTHVQVTGTLTPVEALNSVQQYDIKGIISATAIGEID
jgi:hypothetical protein